MKPSFPTRSLPTLALALTWLAAPTTFGAAQSHLDKAPPLTEQQLPRAMHSSMSERPRVSVGMSGMDLNGSDNRILQAAVDYIAALGGGTVEIGAGTFVMHDSLHLRPGVTVRGTPGKTILSKAEGALSPLSMDGDFGEEQITVAAGAGFEVGYGVTITDDQSGGFHTTVARITGRSGNTFSINKPLNADCMVGNKAYAATVFPVISGYDLENTTIEHLIIEGNKEKNRNLNGCRGAGIFLYRGFGTTIRDCIARGYNGDGISFQQSNDVLVERCIAEDNAGLGLHPGSGSQRATIRDCVARRNGEDGLFLCWRVRHGVFENNVLEANGRAGISIGHKDTDNLIRGNQVRSNLVVGVLFRDESAAMAGHRNRIEDNRIENNGLTKDAPGIHVRGETAGLEFRNNIIRDTREASKRRQAVGVQFDERVGDVVLQGNTIEGKTDDRRKKEDDGKSETRR